MKKESQLPKIAHKGAEFLFNPIAEEIPEALSIRFNQMVYEMQRAGRDVTVLSLGEAFFDIPLFDFSALDFQNGNHYSDSQGLPELRKKIGQYYERFDVQINPVTDVLISAGSKLIIYLSMLAVAQTDEEIIFHEPCWVSYPEQARLCGLNSVFIPYDVSLSQFEQYLNSKTRMVVLNNPNNPAGKLYTAQEMKTLYELCNDRSIYLLVDEAYCDFILDGSFVSAASLDPKRRHLIVVNSLSKSMGMSGWRIGYVIANPEFIHVLLKLNQHIITCAPTILTMYCAHYFDDILKCTLPQAKEIVHKRQRIAKMIADLGLETMSGSSTFYFFLSLDPYPGTSIEFCESLLQEYGISAVPGIAYGRKTDRFIRLSIGTESEERIFKALQIIRNMIISTTCSGAVFTTEQNLESTF